MFNRSSSFLTIVIINLQTKPVTACIIYSIHCHIQFNIYPVIMSRILVENIGVIGILVFESGETKVLPAY